MKYIKLYEDFNSEEIISEADDMIGFNPNTNFDWMPYDSKKDDPIQSSMPETLGYNELKSFVQEAIASGSEKQISESGLFIAHEKTSKGGFNRYVLSSYSPMLFDMSIFDSKYEKISEFKDLNPNDVNVSDVASGAGLIGRYGKKRII